MRRAARVDLNQAAIVAELRRNGCTVQSLASIGHGCPDLLVGYAGVNLLMEVKNPLRPPSKQRLTDDEKDWGYRWAGALVIVRTAYEALQAVRQAAGKQSGTSA